MSAYQRVSCVENLAARYGVILFVEHASPLCTPLYAAHALPRGRIARQRMAHEHIVDRHSPTNFDLFLHPGTVLRPRLTPRQQCARASMTACAASVTSSRAASRSMGSSECFRDLYLLSIVRAEHSPDRSTYLICVAAPALAEAPTVARPTRSRSSLRSCNTSRQASCPFRAVFQLALPLPLAALSSCRTLSRPCRCPRHSSVGRCWCALAA